MSKDKSYILNRTNKLVNSNFKNSSNEGLSINKVKFMAMMNGAIAFQEAVASRMAYRESMQPVTGSTINESRQSLEQQSEMSYRRLYVLLDQKVIRQDLTANMRNLKTLLNNSIKSNDFSKVDEYFDLRKTENHTVEIIKLGDVKKDRAKLPLFKKMNSFGQKVANAFSEIVSNERAI